MQSRNLNELNPVNISKSGYKRRHYTTFMTVYCLFITAIVLGMALWSLASDGFFWTQCIQFMVALWMVAMAFVKLFDSLDEYPIFIEQ